MDSNSEHSVTASNAEIKGFSEQAPLPFRFAHWWNKHAPRAKGAVPRLVGRKFCRGMRTLITTEHGAKLAVHPSSLDVYTHIWAHQGTYDPHVVDACAKLLRPGEMMYDIGANVGLVSLDLMARFAKQGGISIEAFEPQPTLAKSLAISARINGYTQLRVHGCLLSDQSGTQELFVPAHSLHASVVSRSDGAKSIVCQKVRLDDLLATGAIKPPSLIKIDVEGAERMVFEGARNLLAQQTPSVLFEADSNMKRFGYQRADLFAMLRDNVDYHFVHIEAPRNSWGEFDQNADPNSLPDGNYAAVSPQHRDRLV